MRSVKIAIILTALLMAAVPFCAQESEADADNDQVYYCYSYDLAFIYTGGTVGDITVSWSAVGKDASGNTIDIKTLEPYPSAENDWRVVFDPEDVKKCTEVVVTQTVQRDNDYDAQSFKVIILPPPESGRYIITFFDGYSGAALFVSEINGTSYVEQGESHVVFPENPVRDGYSFLGWFTGPGLNQRFDATVPITSDMDVYAKWSETPEVSVDLILYVLVGIIAVMAVILAAVLIRLRKQRT